MGTVLTDSSSREQFKTAVFQICGTDEPTRGELRELGREAAELAGRAKPWGGAHLYTLLHFERWPKYGIHPSLLDALLKRAGMTALNDRAKVTVLARGVRAGAVVLAKSRRCKRYRCGVHFVPRTPNQIYCSDECEKRIAAFRRKRRRKART